MNTEVAREPLRLEVHTFNGKRSFRLDHCGPGLKKPAGELGESAFVDIPEALYGASLDKITIWFLQAESDGAKKPLKKTWQNDPELRAKMIERLAMVIQQSNQEGEVLECKTLYMKLAGHAFEARADQ